MLYLFYRMAEITKLSILDYIVALSTIIISLGVGIFFGWKKKQHNSVTNTRGQLNIVPAAFSLTVSYMSSIGILGTPADIYFYGINSCFMMITYFMASVLGCATFVKFFYSLQMSTANKVCAARQTSRFQNKKLSQQ